MLLGRSGEGHPDWFAVIKVGKRWVCGGRDRVALLSEDYQTTHWEANVQGDVYSLAVSANRLLASTTDGIVYCFGAPDQTPADPSLRGKTPNRAVRRTSKSVVQNRVVAEVHRHIPSRSGYALVIGDALQEEAVALADHGFHVVWNTSQTDVARAVRVAERRTKRRGRLIVHTGAADRLPYRSKTFNVVVIDKQHEETLPNVAVSEALRVIAPYSGIAMCRQTQDSRKPTIDSAFQTIGAVDEWQVFRRTPNDKLGDWTHLYGNLANTSCSNDQAIQGPFALQWFGQPGPQDMLDRHHRAVGPLYKNGVLFVPGDNRIYGVDAFNGMVLWEREVPNSRRVAAMRDCGNMAATNDTLYVATAHKAIGFDAVTGAAKHRLTALVGTDGSTRDWGYLAFTDDAIIGSATKVGASRRDHSKQQIRETFWDFIPAVTSESLFRMAPATATEAWRYQAVGAILNPTLCIADRRIYFVESANPETLDSPNGRAQLRDLLKEKALLVALDVRTGQQVFREPVDLRSTQHNLYMLYDAGRIVLVGTKNVSTRGPEQLWFDIHGFDAATGKLVWSQTQNQRQKPNGDHGEQDRHPAIVGGKIYVEPLAYDVRTGKRVESWVLNRGGHGCGSLTASASACFFRAGNPTMCDLTTGKISKVTQVSRPGCWINIIPAGGLLLIPEASSGCTCNFPVQASMAFGPEEAHD